MLQGFKHSYIEVVSHIQTAGQKCAVLDVLCADIYCVIRSAEHDAIRLQLIPETDDWIAARVWRALLE